MKHLLRTSSAGKHNEDKNGVDIPLAIVKTFTFFACLVLGALPVVLCLKLGVLRPDTGFLILFSSMILALALYFSLGCCALRALVPDYPLRLGLGTKGHAGETALMAISCNLIVHCATLLLVGVDFRGILLICASAVFFTYPLYYLVTLLWSLQSEVRAILRGEMLVNTRYFANLPRRVRTHKEYLPLTISLPVHTESNEVIFETIQNCQRALTKYQSISKKEANLVVSDDGLAKLLGGSVSAEKLSACTTEAGKHFRAADTANTALLQAAERIAFYRQNNISFVARPVQGRKGKFKKGGNLNYTSALAWHLARGAEPQTLFATNGPFAGGYAEGDIRIYELICLLDKDSGLALDVLAATTPEFAADTHLAFTQHTTRAANAHDNYFSWLQARFTNMVYQVALPCKALQGLQVHLMGHSAFLRRSFLEATGGWAEDRVSEDYAKALDAYSTGWHGKYIAYPGLAFTEHVCTNFVEESDKQLRYCYGVSEVVLGGRHRLTAAQNADMLIYYLSYFNLAAALPVIVLLLATHQIYYLFAGILISALLFLLLPTLQGWLLGAPAGFAGCLNTVRYFIMSALAYVGYAYSMLRGFAVYFLDQVQGSYENFHVSCVDKKEHSFAVGLALIKTYAKQNTPALAAWLLIALGCVSILGDIPPHIIRPLVALFLLTHTLAPLILTPQLFVQPKFSFIKRLSKRAASLIFQLLS